jgi:hypothetical protein
MLGMSTIMMLVLLKELFLRQNQRISILLKSQKVNSNMEKNLDIAEFLIAAKVIAKLVSSMKMSQKASIVCII